jgi:hypothetical protein
VCEFYEGKDDKGHPFDCIISTWMNKWSIFIHTFIEFESCGGDVSSIHPSIHPSKFIKECECAIGVCKGVVDTNYPKFFFFKIEKTFIPTLEFM